MTHLTRNEQAIFDLTMKLNELIIRYSVISELIGRPRLGHSEVVAAIMMTLHAKGADLAMPEAHRAGAMKAIERGAGMVGKKPTAEEIAKEDEYHRRHLELAIESVELLRPQFKKVYDELFAPMFTQEMEE